MRKKVKTLSLIISIVIVIIASIAQLAKLLNMSETKKVSKEVEKIVASATSADSSNEYDWHADKSGLYWHVGEEESWNLKTLSFEKIEPIISFTTGPNSDVSNFANSGAYDAYVKSQGMTVAGNYVLVALIDPKDESKNTIIIVLNKNSGKIEKIIDNNKFKFGHANDMAYDGKYVYVSAGGGKIFRFIFNGNLPIKDTGNNFIPPEEVSINNSPDITASTIGYDSSLNRYVIRNGSKYYLMTLEMVLDADENDEDENDEDENDENKKQKHYHPIFIIEETIEFLPETQLSNTSKQGETIPDLTPQGIECYNGYIYYCNSEGGAASNYQNIYNPVAKEKDTNLIHMINIKKGLNEKSRQTLYLPSPQMEGEGCSFDSNGNFYMSYDKNNSTTNHNVTIYKTTVINNIDTTRPEISVEFKSSSPTNQYETVKITANEPIQENNRLDTSIRR